MCEGEVVATATPAPSAAAAPVDAGHQTNPFLPRVNSKHRVADDAAASPGAVAAALMGESGDDNAGCLSLRPLTRVARPPSALYPPETAGMSTLGEKHGRPAQPHERGAVLPSTPIRIQLHGLSLGLGWNVSNSFHGVMMSCPVFASYQIVGNGSHALQNSLAPPELDHGHHFLDSLTHPVPPSSPFLEGIHPATAAAATTPAAVAAAAGHRVPPERELVASQQPSDGTSEGGAAAAVVQSTVDEPLIGLEPFSSGTSDQVPSHLKFGAPCSPSPLLSCMSFDSCQHKPASVSTLLGSFPVASMSMAAASTTLGLPNFMSASTASLAGNPATQNMKATTTLPPRAARGGPPGEAATPVQIAAADTPEKWGSCSNSQPLNHVSVPKVPMVVEAAKRRTSSSALVSPPSSSVVVSRMLDRDRGDDDSTTATAFGNGAAGTTTTLADSCRSLRHSSIASEEILQTLMHGMAVGGAMPMWKTIVEEYGNGSLLNDSANGPNDLPSPRHQQQQQHPRGAAFPPPHAPFSTPRRRVSDGDKRATSQCRVRDAASTAPAMRPQERMPKTSPVVVDGDYPLGSSKTDEHCTAHPEESIMEALQGPLASATPPPYFLADADGSVKEVDTSVSRHTRDLSSPQLSIPRHYSAATTTSMPFMDSRTSSCAFTRRPHLSLYTSPRSTDKRSRVMSAPCFSSADGGILRQGGISSAVTVLPASALHDSALEMPLSFLEEVGDDFNPVQCVPARPPNPDGEASRSSATVGHAQVTGGKSTANPLMLKLGSVLPAAMRESLNSASAYDDAAEAVSAGTSSRSPPPSPPPAPAIFAHPALGDGRPGAALCSVLPLLPSEPASERSIVLFRPPSHSHTGDRLSAGLPFSSSAAPLSHRSFGRFTAIPSLSPSRDTCTTADPSTGIISMNNRGFLLPPPMAPFTATASATPTARHGISVTDGSGGGHLLSPQRRGRISIPPFRQYYDVETLLDEAEHANARLPVSIVPVLGSSPSREHPMVDFAGSFLSLPSTLRSSSITSGTGTSDVDAGLLSLTVDRPPNLLYPSVDT